MGTVPGYDVSYTDDPDWSAQLPTAWEFSDQNPPDWWWDSYGVALPTVDDGGNLVDDGGTPQIVGGGAIDYPDWWNDAYYTALPAYYDPKTGTWTPADGNWTPGTFDPETGKWTEPEWDGKNPIPTTGYVDGYGSDFDHRFDWPGWEEPEAWQEDDPGWEDAPWYWDEQQPTPNHRATNPSAIAWQRSQRYQKGYGAMGASGPLKRRVRRSQTKRAARLHKPRWIDPFPWIPGTEPEKRVFEMLVQKGIYFVFQGQIPEFEEGWYVTLSVPGYEPDFVLPQYRVIIDPWSPFHHSIPEHQAEDIQKVALYEAMGYRYYHPWALGNGIWSFDQVGVPHFRGNTLEMLSAIVELAKQPLPITYWKDLPCLNTGYRIGQNLGAGANSVAAANRARTRARGRALSRGIRAGRRTRP